MSYGCRWLRKSFAGRSRRPELRAHTVSPASHRVLMAMPPPAPVPTTITSKTFGAIPGALARSDLRRLQVAMARVAGMRTPRGLPVDPKPRIVELLQADLGGVEAHQGVLADEPEELPALFLSRAVAIPVGELAQQLALSLLLQRAEGPAEEPLPVGVEPGQAVPEAELHPGIARDHEVDELGDPRLASPGGAVAGNDQLGQALDRRVLFRGEEARRVARRTDLQGSICPVAAGEGPAMEARVAAGPGRDRQDAQHLAPLDSLPGHGRLVYAFTPGRRGSSLSHGRPRSRAASRFHGPGRGGDGGGQRVG